jgi:hypothetical protein
MTPIATWIALETGQYHWNVGGQWMRAHQIEHAQSADGFHFQTENNQLRHPVLTIRKFSRRKQILQRFAAIEQMQHACARRDLFESHERGLRVQRVIVYDQDIGVWNHTKAHMQGVDGINGSRCTPLKFRLE